MKRSLIPAIMLTALIGATCSTRKKSTSTASAPPPAKTEAAPSNTVAAGPAPRPTFLKLTGVASPGDEQLKAIQAQYPNATLQILTKGYSIYTGACTNCHRSYSIYDIETGRWPGIIDNMAKKAEITDEQKDAVYKYVMAVKATQPG